MNILLETYRFRGFDHEGETLMVMNDMNRSVKFGLILIAANCVVWGLLVLAFFQARQYGIKFYPGISTAVSVLLPLFYSHFLVKGFVRAKAEKLSRPELITFAAISLIGIAIASYVTEAAICYSAFAQFNEKSFMEILSAPVWSRYNVTALLGMSFFISVMLINTYVALIRVPVSVALRVRAEKPENRDITS